MTAFGGILSGIFGGVAGDILNVIAGALESALNTMITALTTFWVDIGTRISRPPRAEAPPRMRSATCSPTCSGT